MNRPRERAVQYDMLRVLLMIVVVLGHANFLVETGENGVDGVNYTAFFDYASPLFTPLYEGMVRVVNWIYSFHMSLFFMLSGAVACLGRPPASFGEQCRKKGKRLVLPYFTYGLLFLLPLRFISGYYATGQSLKSAVGYFLGLEQYGHLWFLVALFWCFVLFYPIGKYVMPKSVPAGVAAALGVQLLLQASGLTVFCLSFVSYYFIYFALGYAFEHYRPVVHSFVQGRRGLGPALFLALALLLALNLGFGLAVPRLYATLLNGGLVYMLCCWLVGHTGVEKTRFFGVMVEYSMYIYLLHNPMNYLILAVTARFGVLRFTWGVVAYYFARILGVVIASLVLGWAIQKLREWGKARLARLFPVRETERQ